jgi:ferrous iron transport protein A
MTPKNPTHVATTANGFYTGDEFENESQHVMRGGFHVVDLAVPLATPLRLDALAIGADARVSDVVGADAVSLRLLEMGLTPGARVRVVGRAPLGDPWELEVRGYRLSIRRAEAARVLIER